MLPFRPTYHERMMGTIAVVLLLAILLVRGWPQWSTSKKSSMYSDRSTNRIQIREIQPTSQSEEKNPPPPAPLPPIVVPNEVTVKEEIEFGESELQVETPEDDAVLQEGADQATASRPPDTGAQLLKNVQPTYPAAAQQDEVRARIQVEVQIGPNGRVENAAIRRRWRLYPDGSSHPVEELGYGLEKAALAAAQRSLFRPAQASGRPVATRKVLTFTFGSE